MLSKEKIDRINELSSKSKTIGLTEAEKEEQKSLREEYLVQFRVSFKQQLDSIEIVDAEEIKN